MSRWGPLSSLARNRSERLVSLVLKNGSVRLASLVFKNVCQRQVSHVLKNGFVRLVSQGPKKVSKTGLSTLRKWASDINLTRAQNGFERLVSLSLVLGYRPVRLVSVNIHRVYVRLVSPVYKKTS